MDGTNDVAVLVRKHVMLKFVNKQHPTQRHGNAREVYSITTKGDGPTSALLGEHINTSLRDQNHVFHLRTAGAVLERIKPALRDSQRQKGNKQRPNLCGCCPAVGEHPSPWIIALDNTRLT